MSSSPRPHPPRPAPPRLFALYRFDDANARSGTGVVAWGVEWPDGRARTWWLATKTGVHQIEWWNHVGEVSRVHGHSTRTRIVALGSVAAVELFDTAEMWGRFQRFQAAQAVHDPGDFAIFATALDIARSLVPLLRAHDALAMELAAVRAERDQLRAEADAQQAHLDVMADMAGGGPAREGAG